MNIIQLLDAPSQEFSIGDYRIRLNFNYIANSWSFTIFNSESAVVTCGNFLYAGLNILEAVGSKLTVVDSVSCPVSNWYDRLVKPYFDGLPQTVLVYDV